jgi:hypothetical protein
VGKALGFVYCKSWVHLLKKTSVKESIWGPSGSVYVIDNQEEPESSPLPTPQKGAAVDLAAVQSLYWRAKIFTRTGLHSSKTAVQTADLNRRRTAPAAAIRGVSIAIRWGLHSFLHPSPAGRPNDSQMVQVSKKDVIKKSRRAVPGCVFQRFPGLIDFALVFAYMTVATARPRAMQLTPI